MRLALTLTLILSVIGVLLAEQDGKKGPAQFFDDGAFRKLQTDRGRALQAKGRLVEARELAKQLDRDSASLSLPEAAALASPLSLRDIYRKCSQSVFSIAEVRLCDGCGKIHVTPYGTGFAITAGGVLLTSRHLITELDSSSQLIASTPDGNTYAVVEVLASSERDDAAVIRIDGSGFKPLPLSPDNFTGTRVAVISNPRGHLYSLSEGIVTRLFTQFSTRHMLISAEYATGSSGAPVIDASGNVVGMVALTSSLNDQMILRGCIPSQSLLELVTDADFGTPDDVYDPLATERACLDATFVAMQQLVREQGDIPSKQFDQRLGELLAVMKHAVQKCPDHPVAKQYARIVEMQRRPSKSQVGEQGGADQPATAVESKSEGKEKPKTESEGRSQ